MLQSLQLKQGELSGTTSTFWRNWIFFKNNTFSLFYTYFNEKIRVFQFFNLKLSVLMYSTILKLQRIETESIKYNKIFIF